jgi:hypothetical protein
MHARSRVSRRTADSSPHQFPEEMEPVYEELYEEQQERRQLDQVRVTKNIIYIDRINVALDVDVKERIESDQLIEKLAISRLDNMQRKLVAQIEAGFKALQVRLRRTNLQNHPQACVGLQTPGTEIRKVHHEPC